VWLDTETGQSAESLEEVIMAARHSNPHSPTDYIADTFSFLHELSEDTHLGELSAFKLDGGGRNKELDELIISSL
jgi:hypothetical protein